MTSLKLVAQSISDISQLQPLSKLASLDLSNNLITDISPICRKSGESTSLDAHKALTRINIANNKIEKVNISLLQHFGVNSNEFSSITLDDNYIPYDCSIASGYVSAMRQKMKEPNVLYLKDLPVRQTEMEIGQVNPGRDYSVTPYLEYPPGGYVKLYDARDSYDEDTYTVTARDLRSRSEITFEVATYYSADYATYQASYIDKTIIK